MIIHVRQSTQKRVIWISFHNLIAILAEVDLLFFTIYISV